MMSEERYFDMMTHKEFKKLRKRLGLSPEEMAQKMDVTSRTIYRWEKGQSPIHPVFAREIRQLANCADKGEAA